jgi:peptide-methionine (S)-S-oxide reductase
MNLNLLGGAFAAAALLGGATLIAHPAATAVGPSSTASAPAPAPLIDAVAPAAGTETAILSGGCFWGVQGVFEHVRGVRSVVAGYAGGAAGTASYELVSTGATGHAESVLITFDPRQISYGEILRIFFSVATDPTQLDQQYPDYGSQYRSEIFYANPEQARIARAYVAQLDRSGFFTRPIATRVDPARGFYPAEAYHQDYLVRHPDQPYIAAWDLPKVAALERQFPSQFQATPITVASR